jgi:putative spermidine/putrescine transport system permease protein
VLAPCVKAIPLAFITSLDEVVILLFIAGGDTATLTRRMFNELRDEIDPTIAAISTLLILMSVVLLGLTQLLQRSPSSAPATDQAAGKR